jgi:predicted P-loop ATPase
MVANFNNNGQSGEFARVTKDNPCPHCGKPDWCYFIGELSVCSRDDEPAIGWKATSKNDKDGHAFYAPIDEEARPRFDREFARKKPIPQYLSLKHIEEFATSSIPEDLARLNARGAECPHQIANFLDWQGYKGSGGWLYTGVDPETGKDTGLGQFKPDTELIFPDGNKAKYLSQKRGYDATCPRVLMWVWRKVSNRYSVPMPDSTAVINDSDEVTAAFWPWVIANPQLPIDPAEGLKKALSLLAQGFIGIAISGVDMATIKGRGSSLVPSLKKLAVKGRPVVINYDADIVKKTEVRDALIGFGAALTQRGATAAVRTWDLELGKGIDDLITAQGENWEGSTEILGYNQWLKSLENKKAVEQDSFDSARTYSKLGQLAKLIEKKWGKRLRFNEMAQQVEMDGKPCKLDRIYIRAAKELRIDISKEKASDLVLEVAQENTYSPVRDYLNSLAEVTPIDLNSLAKRYFGTDDPLHATFLKHTLIAAVARAFVPGCQVDTTCILQGNQGLFKSRFWQTLTGDEWFTDNLSEANEKDEKMKLRHSWILEYSEFETVYKRKEVSQLKSFLTSRIDSLRVPYGRSIEKFPRTSIFVGTTNRQEFLSDSTGERRFLVIPVSQPIPIKTVEAERDSIWAAAVAAYRNNEQWWLNAEENKLLAEANKGWQASDTWETNILNYIEHRDWCTVGELLEKVIGLDLAQQKRAEQMRVADILRCNGWEKAMRRIDGKQQKGWQKVVTGSNEVVTEVVTPQNPLPVSIPETVLLPVTTSNSKHFQNSDLTAEIVETENFETFEVTGGNTPVVTPETPTPQDLEPVTTSLLPPAQNDISKLVEQVKAAQTWAEVTVVWGDDLELKERIKAQLPKDELKRIGKLYKQALTDSEQPQVCSASAEPIAITDNQTNPEPAEPAENGEVVQ